MLDFIRWLMTAERTVRLILYRTFFVSGALFAIATLGWIDASVISTSLYEVPLTIASIFIASSLLVLILVPSRFIVPVCRWSRRRLLSDSPLLDEADAEFMTTSRRRDFERMNDELEEFDVLMGTVLTGLAVMTVVQHTSGPAATAEGLASLLASIACIFLLLWLAAGALVLRRAERGRYGTHLALALLVRRAARLRKLPIPSRLQRRLIVRQYRGLRAV